MDSYSSDIMIDSSVYTTLKIRNHQCWRLTVQQCNMFKHQQNCIWINSILTNIEASLNHKQLLRFTEVLTIFKNVFENLRFILNNISLIIY